MAKVGTVIPTKVQVPSTATYYSHLLNHRVHACTHTHMCAHIH